MPVEHELDLLENAFDSLNESLRKYQEGLDGDFRAYKFAILHYAHFIELLFKYYVTESHPLLIYRTPFSNKIKKEKTIGLWEAVQFLKNEGKEIDTSFFNDMEWLKELRNDIEHYKFTMKVAEVRRTIGRLTRSIIVFNENHANIDIYDHIGSDEFKIFEELGDKYKAALTNAQKEAEEESVDGDIYDCYICSSEYTAVNIKGKYICKLCKEEDPETECRICFSMIRESEGIVWNDDRAPHIDYVCDSCYERFNHM